MKKELQRLAAKDRRKLSDYIRLKLEEIIKHEAQKDVTPF